MRRERATRIGVCVLLLATVALTGCRLAEHGRRAAIDAFASFVLDSVFQAPLTQPAPKTRRHVTPSVSEGPGRAVAAIAVPPAPPGPSLTLGVTPLPKPHLRICRVRIIVIARPDPATL